MIAGSLRLAARCLLLVAALSPCAMAAAPAEKPPPPQRHPTGAKFIPADVDWDRPVYQASFDDPAALEDWKLEGGLRMTVADGSLILESKPGSTKSEPDANHLTCWLKKEMPADFLLEFTVRPHDRKQGLNIVFFSTRGILGESIFDPALAPRDGVFKQYHSGDLNGYHIRTTMMARPSARPGRTAAGSACARWATPCAANTAT